MGRYKQIDHTADIAVSVSGSNVEDLFQTASRAWRQIVMGNSEIAGVESQDFTLRSESLEELLVECLSELNYLLIVKHWIFQDYSNLHITRLSSDYKLTARISGEPLRKNKHRIELEIKAVTFHQMNIRKAMRHLETIIIFDI
ncbi:MAG: archease [bacterium]|nr:MAG: archease [bacterium]